MSDASWEPELVQHGFAPIRLDSAEHLLSVARQLGRPIPSRRGGDLVHRLRPVTQESAHPRSLSAFHGTGAFPMHTDGAHHRHPPHFLILRCVEPSSAGRPTLLADANALQMTAAEQLALRRAVFVVDGGATGPFLASALVEDRTGAMRVRYDPGCMRPAHPAFEPAPALLAAALGRSPVLRVKWAADDGMIIDNWRCLHGRADTDQDDGDRLLERVTVA